MAMIEFPALRTLDTIARAAIQKPGVRLAGVVLGFGLALLVLLGPGAAFAGWAGALLGLQLAVWRTPAASAEPDAPLSAAGAAGLPIAAVARSMPSAWRELVDAFPDPAVTIDRDLMIVHANPSAFALFPAMQRRAPFALVSRTPEMVEAIDLAMRHGRPRSAVILERVPVERRLDVGVAPLPAAGAGEAALLIIFRDASERDRLVQMRTDFIAHASHELRTPLAALRGFIETLQGPARNDSAARERFLDIMAAEAARMTRLLDDLLSLSRVEMRAHLAPTGSVDITQTLIAVEQMLQPVAMGANVTLSVEAPAGPREIRGDRDEIVQMLVNLIQNAIKYGRRGGAVIVRTTEVDAGRRRRLRIAVIDDGPGIAEAHIPRLTERFYRVDDKTSRDKGGTGLGLAIVKHILNRHDGRLEIQSVLGKGSTFTVDLPLVGEK